LIQRLSEDDLDPGVLAEAWHALLAFAQQKSWILVTHQDWLCQRILMHLASNDQSLRHACVTFLVHMSRMSSISQGELAQAFAHLLTTAAGDVSPLVRAETLQALPRLMASEPNNDHFRNLLDALIIDREGTVRAAAIRAVGLLLVPAGDIEGAQTTEPVPPTVAIPYATKTLKLRIDDETGSSTATTSPLMDTTLLVRLRASWTLGNLCQAIKNLASPSAAPSSPHLLLALLAASTRLLSDDERIAINALRSVGLVLSVVDVQELHNEGSAALSQVGHVERALRGVLQAVRAAKNPKTKWNGLNALQTALSNETFRRWLTAMSNSNSSSGGGKGEEKLRAQLMRLLSEHLKHKTFKVKLAAIGCLLLLLPPVIPLTPTGSEMSASISAGTGHTTAAVDNEEMESIRAAVQGALQRLDAEVAEGNFAEVRVHGESVRRGLEELMERLAGLKREKTRQDRDECTVVG
jgi:hypothetical protein